MVGAKKKESIKASTNINKEIVFNSKAKTRLRKTKKKFTKTLLRKTSVRPIPKHRLEEVMKMLNNPDHDIWRERSFSCNKSIHRSNDAEVTDFHVLLKFARQCLLRRNWKNLLEIFQILIRKNNLNAFIPLFAKYGAICLAHIDKNLLNNFTRVCVDADGDNVLKACTILGHKDE